MCYVARVCVRTEVITKVDTSFKQSSPSCTLPREGGGGKKGRRLMKFSEKREKIISTHGNISVPLVAIWVHVHPCAKRQKSSNYHISEECDNE